VKKPNSIHQNVKNNLKQILKKVEHKKLLTDHLKDQYDIMSILHGNSQISNYLNGNVSIDTLVGNEHTQISEKNIETINSFNLNNSTELNLKSHNTLNKVSSSGDIQTLLNKGLINIANTISQASSTRLAKRKNLIDIQKHYVIEHPQELENQNANKPFEYRPIPKVSQIIKQPEIKGYLQSKDSGLIYDSSLASKHEDVSRKKISDYQIQFQNDVEYNPSHPKPPQVLLLTNKTDEETQNKTIEKNVIEVTNQNTENNDSVKINETNVIAPEALLDKSNLTNNSLSIEEKVKYVTRPIGGKTRALILGEGNQIKDNHVVNNIIRVHNSFILAKKLLQNGRFNPNVNLSKLHINPSIVDLLNNKTKGSDTINSTSLPQGKCSNCAPSTIIIVNANKATKKESCSKKLCHICEDDKCRKCKVHTNKLIDYSCECKEGYYYNEEFDHCEGKN
jgi:hypothetical protein